METTTQINVPLDDTAVLDPRVLPHLGLKKDGKIILVFPRGTPGILIEKMANKYAAEVYTVDVRISFEVLETNRPYDHSPKISL